MPATSEKQRKAACVALSAKEGKSDPSKLKGASKQMYDSMSKKELKDFCKSKVEESTKMPDNHILTEAQKKELTKVIDTLVEERVEQRKSEFVKKYTKFIVESATSKVVERMREGLLLKVEEKIQDVKTKAEKACRSVLAEAASKVSMTKKQHKQLIEEFRKTAPKLIEEEAQKKADQLTEEARGAIEENNRLSESYQKITEGLTKAGYVINEDIDNAIEKERNEKRMLRTKLIEARREIKINQLTEGMLPGQKKKIVELMEDCVTEKQVEDRFLSVKTKVLAEDRHVETEDKSKLRKQQNLLESKQREEDEFSSLLGASKNFINGNL